MLDNERLMADKEALERAYKASIAELENLTNQRVRKFQFFFAKFLI